MNPILRALFILVSTYPFFDSSPAIAGDSGQACRLAVALMPGTFDRRPGESSSAATDQLLERLSKGAPHSVELIVPSTSSSALSQALKKKAHLLLELSATSRSADGYVVAALRKLPENEVVSDTSASRGNTTEALNKIEQWYKSSAATLSCKDYSEKDINLPAPIPTKEEPHANVLSVKFEKVPAGAQKALLKAVDQVDLENEVLHTTTQLSQLRILCSNDCEKGRMRLELPYREQPYRQAKGGSKDRLLPYRSVATSLLKVRDRVVGSEIKQLETEILLTDVNGSELKITVSGNSQKPNLKPDSPAEAFFGD